MSRGQQTESAKTVVLSLQSEDWVRAVALAPSVESSIRAVCRLHRKTPIFGASGDITPLVRTRLGSLSKKNMAIAVGPVLGVLTGKSRAWVDAGLDPEAALAADEAVGDRLARLVRCELDVFEEFITNEADADDGLEAEIEPEPEPQGEIEPGVDAEAWIEREVQIESAVEPEDTPSRDLTRERLAAARTELPNTRAAASRLLDAFDQERVGDLADFDVLTSWRDTVEWLAEVCPGALTLGEIEAALDEADGAVRQAQLRNNEVAAARADLAVLHISEGASRHLREAIDAFVSSASDVDDEELKAHRALCRVLLVPAYDVSDDDVELVATRFGAKFARIASGEIAVARGAAESVKDVDPEPERNVVKDVDPEPERNVVEELDPGPERDPVKGVDREPHPEPDLRPEAADPLSESRQEPERVTGDALWLPRVLKVLNEAGPTRAYWYAVALQAPPPALSLLEIRALLPAIAWDGDATAMRVRALLGELDATDLASERDLLKVLAGTAAEAALLMPFSAATTLLDDSLVLLGGDAPLFLGALLDATNQGLTLGSSASAPLPALVADRDEAVERLRTEFETLRQRKSRLQRSSAVWLRLSASNGALGSVVAAVLEDPRANVGRAEDLIQSLSDQKAIDKLIDMLDLKLSPIAARKGRIVAGARADVRDLATALLELLQQVVAATRAVQAREREGHFTEGAQALEHLMTTLAEHLTAESAGDLTLDRSRGRLSTLLQTGHAADEQAEAPNEVLARELVLCYEVARHADGRVDLDTLTESALDALPSRDVFTAYQGFAERDDHGGIERLLDQVREDGETDLIRALEERQSEDLKISRERVSKQIAQADLALARALSSGVLTETGSAAMSGRLERLRAEVSTTLDFQAAKREVAELTGELTVRREETLSRARDELHRFAPPAAVAQRISRLLDLGDIVNAHEFLAQLATGATELPEEAKSDDTLRSFWPVTTDRLVSQGDSNANLDWLRQLAVGDVDGANPIMKQGVLSWVQLALEKRTHGYEERLRDVLRALGLEVPASGFSQQERAQRNRWWTSFAADRRGHALVPAYGSQSGGRYQLLLCWEQLTPDALLELIQQRPKTPPTIVLYFGTLTRRERRAIIEKSRPRGKNVATVVVDNAVLAFLLTREEAALHVMLGASLPFTTINPYTPFVLGDVPREVFYGRKVELDLVQAAHGPLFVYGGRQLGKSALLKTAMREFKDANLQWRSVYVDLKAEGVGEWRQPEDVWQVLLPQLQSAGILDAKVSTKAPAQVIVDGIRRWLDEDEERRFLLLLDEADAFLETDARARPDAPGEARFVNVYRLKSLMDGTGRRFKPVFAGLHQVQRFHSASNGPMAHVGTEIPVGPLDPSEAYKLVVRPMTAIGYEFESPDTVWRLLNYTNYQASLIQLFCDALVRRIHSRGLVGTSPPIMVTDDLIDEVYSDKELRDQIATRFEWTVNLDNRYRVIAYTTAWMTLVTEQQFFSSTTLLDECNNFWSTGFEELSLDDFVAYLEELIGLGILVRTPKSEYGIRSPNVIRLLGSSEEIDRRLSESNRLELSKPFDPALYRRALQGHAGWRSPVTEQQVKGVLDRQGVIHLLVGSEALGLSRVPLALRDAAEEGIEVHEVSPGELGSLLTNLARRRAGRRHVVLDARGADPDDVRKSLRRLAHQVGEDARLTASCLTPPAATWREDTDAETPTDAVQLRPWTEETLRAWAPECPYPLTSERDRNELLGATGGWPELVESVVASASKGLSQARALEQSLAFLEEPAVRDAFLASVGLAPTSELADVVRVAQDWGGPVTFPELVELIEREDTDVSALVQTLVEMGGLARLAGGDVYSVNPLVGRLVVATG